MKYKLGVKNGIFDAILVVICLFVGVGFISGAEIWFYIARFDMNEIFGLIVFGVLMFVISCFALSKKRKVESNNDKFKRKILLISELAVALDMISGLVKASKIFLKIVCYWFLYSQLQV